MSSHGGGSPTASTSGSGGGRPRPRPSLEIISGALEEPQLTEEEERRKDAFVANLAAVPNDLKARSKNVACMVCSLVKEMDQFDEDGCDNCERYLKMKGQGQAHLYTSENFEGLVAMIAPRESWVAKWQHIQTLKAGLYAVSVKGKLPRDLRYELAGTPMHYFSRDKSTPEETQRRLEEEEDEFERRGRPRRRRTTSSSGPRRKNTSKSKGRGKSAKAKDSNKDKPKAKGKGGRKKGKEPSTPEFIDDSPLDNSDSGSSSSSENEDVESLGSLDLSDNETVALGRGSPASSSPVSASGKRSVSGGEESDGGSDKENRAKEMWVVASVSGAGLTPPMTEDKNGDDEDEAMVIADEGGDKDKGAGAEKEEVEDEILDD